MNLKKKVVIALFLLSTAVFVGPRYGWAASQANITVTVSISGSLSLSLSATTYAFGSLGVDVGSIAASAITVTNNSTAFRETYSLSASNTDTDSWTLASAQGSNQFVLAATFSSAVPGGSFVNSTHTLSTTAATCGASGGQFAGNQTGYQQALSAAVSLWFEIVTPTQLTSGSGSTNTSTVSNTAVAG